MFMRCLSLVLACGLLALAPARAGAQQVVPEVVADGLVHPWAVAFLPDGRFLVTERPGHLRLIDAGGRRSAPLHGLPDVAAGGQGGLLDLILDADFASNRTLYFCFSEPDGSGRNSTALARAQLAQNERELQDVQVIFRQQPRVAGRLHFGCRIAEYQLQGQPDGTLLLTLGERFSERWGAQALDNHLGKVVRVGKDGSVPADNPFAGQADALPEIWTLGHRNGQGLALAPDGTFWMHEHGPRGGDEINRLAPGRNYGWPVISYGVNYDGSPVAEGLTAKPGLEQPWHHWTPSIAPSGMAFLTSSRYGADWRGNLFVGSLKFGYLDRIEMANGQVVAEHKLLAERGQRVRDVRQGPDGLLYVLTDAADGELIRLLPAGSR